MYPFFVLSAVSCFYTYWLFSDVDSYNRNSGSVITILYFDIAFILVLLFLGSNKLMELWNSRHTKGSRLTLRLISAFSMLSVVPSVMMCVFSALFFHNGIESWFNKRNQTVLQESLNVAESYLAEHKRNALRDCIAVSRALEYHIDGMGEDEPSFSNERFAKSFGFLLDDLCGLKGIDGAILLDSDMNVIAHSKYSVSLHFLNVNYKKIKETENADKKGLILNVNAGEEEKSIVAASCFFKHSGDYMYLIIEKNVDAEVLSQAKNTRTAYDEYLRLLADRSSLEIAFILMFLIIGVLLLIASIAVAVVYSWRIVKPVSNLIDVSEEIIKGNMKARAKNYGFYEEIQLLSKTFNQMVEQICLQREDLVNINRKLDERIKFIGSVLAGVSSGVIGTDNDSVYIWNTAAEKLLGRKITGGDKISDIFPEMAELPKQTAEQRSSVCREIEFKRGGEVLLFSVKAENLASPNDDRFVITFDDLTDMVMAQKKAAWSEAARRVAHEIKNPLTPIQLSAERIRRKYLPQIKADTEIFSGLIDVIVRQVRNIKRLTDEFNFFARLPEPKLKKCDVRSLCRQAVLLMQNAVEDVEITFSSEDEEDFPLLNADEQLLHQSVVNLVQNAVNALSTVSEPRKKISVYLEKTDSEIKISVEDNGPGFPKEKTESLTTAYFTLMPKGTGLGLAIVKKIVQDHGGRLTLEDSVYGGAKAIMSFPLGTGEKNEQ